MTRRQFAFWLGLGLFGLSETLRISCLDDLAAATMRIAEPSKPEHWTAVDNKTWRWYERENLIDGQWILTGMTTPVHKETGQPLVGREGYLDESLVPPQVLRGGRVDNSEAAADEILERDPGQADPHRRARHGRPPSKWLRSLNADEIRIWLQTIEVPEAGVSGMTFWRHLTRDHSFDPAKIEGLSIDEQAKLHAAAHYGY